MQFIFNLAICVNCLRFYRRNEAADFHASSAISRYHAGRASYPPQCRRWSRNGLGRRRAEYGQHDFAFISARIADVAKKAEMNLST